LNLNKSSLTTLTSIKLIILHLLSNHQNLPHLTSGTSLFWPSNGPVRRIRTFKETDRGGAESLSCYNAHELQQAR